MKKIVLGFALVCAFALASCGGKSTKTETVEPTVVEEVSTEVVTDSTVVEEVVTETEKVEEAV